MKDRADKLSLLSVLFHWVIGVAFVCTLTVGLYMHNFMENGPEKWELLALHKSFGLMIL